MKTVTKVAVQYIDTQEVIQVRRISKLDWIDEAFRYAIGMRTK